VARESAAWIHKADLPDVEKYRLVRRIADAVWLFPRALQRHLLQPAEDEEPFRRDVVERVKDRRIVDEILVARHKPSLALYEMSSAINEIPLDTVQRTTLDKAVSQLCDAMGGCDRIFTSPVPVVYTRFAARFVEVWMLTIPLALYKPFDGSWNHWPL
jgi:predicted membrane chloride channel (bestrophin family)